MGEDASLALSHRNAVKVVAVLERWGRKRGRVVVASVVVEGWVRLSCSHGARVVITARREWMEERARGHCCRVMVGGGGRERVPDDREVGENASTSLSYCRCWRHLGCIGDAGHTMCWRHRGRV